MSAYRARQRNESRLLKDNLKYKKDMKNQEKNKNVAFLSTRTVQRIHGPIQSVNNSVNNSANNINTQNIENMNKIESLEIENSGLRQKIEEYKKHSQENLYTIQNFPKKINEVRNQITVSENKYQQLLKRNAILEAKNKKLETTLQEYKNVETKVETKQKSRGT